MVIVKEKMVDVGLHSIENGSGMRIRASQASSVFSGEYTQPLCRRGLQFRQKKKK